MEKLLDGKPKGTIVDLNDDNIFVIRYQATTHALGQMNGQTLINAERYLSDNKDRYTKLTTNNKP